MSELDNVIKKQKAAVQERQLKSENDYVACIGGRSQAFDVISLVGPKSNINAVRRMRLSA
jgi:hypothetical protein